jgi:2-keto-4-pentenoate hydratase/2-oxohepta-3-ene-1,7-dioic acid hydratase in catechol pathway
MKLCRFIAAGSAAARSGIVEGDSIAEIRGEIWGNRERTGQKFSLESVKFLTPSSPSKVVCVGRNFKAHATELGNELPKEPMIFLKPPSAVIAPGEAIVMPTISKRVDYEGEVALIIGRQCRRLGAADNVNDFLAGYTCLNDVTLRDLQKSDAQWWRAKGFDTSCPFGPIVDTELDPGASVETFVNGFRKQSGRISDWIFSVDVIIRWIAQVMTLEPGDVVAMGTPEGVGPLAPGDTVEVVVSGIGTLRNTVVAAQE